MDQITVFLNGNWIPNSGLHISVDDAGFLLGATVTERLRTFRGQVFRLEEHLHRLRNSLKIVGLDSETICNQVAAAVPEFLHRNHSLIDAGDDWSIVAFVTPGAAGSGRPTVCVHGYPLPFKSWASKYETGVPVIVSEIRQLPPNCLPPELKCRSRMHFYLADREAAAKRPGARAILLDQDGFIAEATTANVVIFRDREGFVSPPHDNILVGVSLGVVEELSARIDVPFVTRRLTVDEFCSADEALLTSTSICALPIVECNGQPIADSKPGPIYRRLLSAWNDLVGLDIAEQARQYGPREGAARHADLGHQPQSGANK
jgi:branched-subunit amino acid aminotransferase/4-amino-4-deoxychorismate lyase